MRTNVKGRVSNTRLNKANALYALFEAVINSIDAIEEASDLSDTPRRGKIVITIKRDPPLPLSNISPSETLVGDINSLEIEDNGQGFTQANFDSFNEADTRYKARRGGKGIGRFLWLKVFEFAEIDSTFREGDSFHRRRFTFSLASDDGVTGHELFPDSSADRERTVIKLVAPREEYRPGIPQKASTIAERLIEHCLEYFGLAKMPEIELWDQETDSSLHLQDLYREMVARTESQSLFINRQPFQLTHFMLHARADFGHRFYFCAHRRVVKSIAVGTKIPHLPPTIRRTEDQQAYVYAAYVSSNYLDDHVDQERHSFSDMEGSSQLFPQELSWSDVEDAVLEAGKVYLTPYTQVVREQTHRRAEEFTRSQAPQYRYIVNKHPEALDAIPPNASDQELDARLYKAHRHLEVEAKEEAVRFLQDRIGDRGEITEEEAREMMLAWDKVNDVGKAALSGYIIHRKLMLEMLDRALRLQGEKYAKESAIHKFIFPLGRTSDDVTYDDHNLWIIDEKLAYHRYLASDIALKRVEPIDSDSSSRPDLLIFDFPIAVVDDEAPYNSGVVIFEFKRPMRNDYDDEENPIAQVYKYVDEIKAGGKTDKAGRPLTVRDTTPFYCYIVCDLTPRLHHLAKVHDLTPTPDGLGYFQFNARLNTYIEVIGFQKLIQDAKKRNRILFDKLQISGWP